MVNSDVKIKAYYDNCNETDALADSWVNWDFNTQEWVITNVFNNGFCNICEKEIQIKWKTENEKNNYF